MLVCWGPCAALAPTTPACPVVGSAAEALSPPTSGAPESGTSLIDTLSTSPGFIFRVWALPKNVARFGSCGAGGPGGTPLSCMNEKLTGSTQLLLQVAKLKLHARLSIVSAAHHFVLLEMKWTHGSSGPT